MTCLKSHPTAAPCGGAADEIVAQIATGRLRRAANVLEALEARTLLAFQPLGDFNTATADSAPSNFVEAGDVAYFVADDGIHGRELWLTDGTAAGTRLVKDINPSPPHYRNGSPAGMSSPTGLTVMNGVLYFFAFDGVAEPALWRSDGTADGTYRLAEVRDLKRIGYSDEAPVFTRLGDKLLFEAYHDDHGVEPWVTDGTPEGTKLLKDLPYYSSKPLPMTALGDHAYFWRDDPQHGTVLWRTDGTPAGTEVLTTLPRDTSGISPGRPVQFDGAIYFPATSIESGRELWRTDGTTIGTRRVADINPGAASSNPSNLTIANGLLFFTAQRPTEGAELWRTDGTDAGTTLVKDLFPGPVSSSQTQHTAAGGQVYFVSGDALWRSDGSDSGTVRVFTAPDTQSPALTELTAVGERLFFSAQSSRWHLPRIWVTDGSMTGAVRITPNAADVTSSYEIPDTAVAPFKGGILFSGHDSRTGVEPWRSDGTAAETTPVADVNRDTRSSISMSTMVASGDYAIFSTPAECGGYDLWATGRSAGEAAARNHLATFRTAVSKYTGVATVGATTYFFAATDQLCGRQERRGLWKTDGTSAGTAFVAGVDYSSRLHATEDGTLFFSAYTPGFGYELWKSDGTPAGTAMLKDVTPESASSYPFVYTARDGYAYFSPNSGSLWRSDGTDAGTGELARNLKLFNESYDSGSVAVGHGGTVFYSGWDAEHGAELWKTDGTPGGAVRLLDINPGANSGSPWRMVTIGDEVFFFARDHEGYGIWRSDGTPEGSRLLVRVPGLTGYSGGPYPLPFNGGLVYAAGAGLWWTDVATARTVRLAAGTYESAVHDGRLYFVARDPDAGAELWSSDGTPEGTSRIADLAPGPEDSWPWDLTPVGDHLYFAASDGVHGLEPWVWTPFARRSGDELIVTTNPGDFGAGARVDVTVQEAGAALHVRIGDASLAFSRTGTSGIHLVGFDERDALTIDGNVTVPLRWDGVLGRLRVAPSARGRLAGGVGTVHVNSLDIDGSGALDLADGALAVHAAAHLRQQVLGQLDSWLDTGRNAADARWQGPGLGSSLAADDPLRGLSISAGTSDADAIVVKYTLNGDVNLDGRITSDDYFRIDSGFLAQPSNPSYAQGDFNYDDRVTSDDYFLIDSAFIGQSARAAAREVIVSSFPAASLADANRKRFPKRIRSSRPSVRALDAPR